jgi:Ankyrin repeats (3 copies)
MENSEITDPLFREAVEAIDSGDIIALEKLLAQYPRLVRDRLNYPPEGYFKDPYLLWFVAGNPIRIDKLPPNIVDVTQMLIGFVKREAPGNTQEQLDYTLGLIATGRIPRECGVQIEMIDLLIDEGAKPGGGLGALAHGNIAAAERLIERGGELTLATAVGLNRMNDVKHLASSANREALLVALTTAAFYGKPDMISYLLSIGAGPNGYPRNNDGFHSHATPLHQAVCSGSLDAVKLLVEADAKLDARDHIYEGTPLGWAGHMQTEVGYDEAAKKNFALIAKYLQEKEQSG